MASRVFKRVGSALVRRSAFDLSHEVKLTADMGVLYPVLCEEMVPGDVWSIGQEAVVRMMPLVAPVLHRIDCYFHTFFVPYRILWDEWEDFITGGPDGSSAAVLPRWEPTDTAVGSLWDYLGMPTGVDPDGAYPLDFIRRAYTRIYNEYYRDETLVTEVDEETNEDLLIRAWEKDYFTSSLLNQQRGTAPALPISGHSHAVWPDAAFTQPTASANVAFSSVTQNGLLMTHGVQEDANAKAFFANNTVDLSSATTFDISDLRLAIQIQRWLERNNRAGARYTEFLRAHFGISPRDDRLQRPEYIGGSKSPVIISEVLQTSETDTTPQGTLAGHGITVDRKFHGKYRCNEFGVVMTIMSIMPKPAYQQGINRQWLRRTKLDFYFPEFANLSEQVIEQAEIYATDVDSENLTPFGYQGRYDEMRYKPNRVCGLMRTTLDYWHLGRQFGAAPVLDQTFIECVPDKRIFAVPSDPGFLINIGHLIKAIRPLPISAEPGYMDH